MYEIGSILHKQKLVIEFEPLGILFDRYWLYLIGWKMFKFKKVAEPLKQI